MNKKQVTVFDVELMWPFLGKVNNDPNYGSGKYEVTVVMSSEQAKKFVEAQISPRQKIKDTEDGRKQIVLKSANLPLVCDANKIRMTPEQMSKIGNGTKANVRANIFDTAKGSFAGIGAIKVTELHEYTSSAFDGLDGEEIKESFQGLDDDDEPF